MAIIKSNDCGGLSVGGGTTVNVSQSNCNCGCGGGGTGGTGGGGTGGGPTPTGGSGGGTGGHPGDGTNGGTGGSPPGSGDDGTPNTDGGDKLLTPSACILVTGTVSKDFGSNGFELVQYDFTTPLINACKTAPGYEDGDKIISAKVSVDGLAYGGAAVFGTQPLVQNRKLTVTDAQNNIRKVAFTEETIGAGILNFVGWRYQDQFPVYIDGGTVKIDGQMPSSLIPDVSVDKNSPAWLKVKVCSVVTHKSNTVVFDFNRWAEVPFSSNLLADKYRVAGFKLFESQEGWHGPDTTGNINYPNLVWPINDSSNYGHYWPIVIGQKPIAPGKTNLHLSGVYGTGASGLILTAKFFEQTSADPAAPYVDLGGVGEIDFAPTTSDGTVFGFDIPFTYPTIGLGLWHISFEINGYNVGFWDLVGAFT